MANVNVVMPKMGESIMEGTVLKWHKKPGEEVELDETLLEIATDKVDADIPAPEAGVLTKILVEEGETVEVGTPIAIINTEGDASAAEEAEPEESEEKAEADTEAAPTERDVTEEEDAEEKELAKSETKEEPGGEGRVEEPIDDGRFYSPLVKSIAEKEGVSREELEGIEGSGKEGRVTKKDILAYLESRGTEKETKAAPAARADRPAAPSRPVSQPRPAAGDRTEIIEMDRMRQIIAEHMVRSKSTSAHVTSFAEVDVTNLVRLREKNKDAFQEREGIKLTYTPFLVRAAVEALREHPLLNASVDGSRIVVKKDFHIGIAVAIGRTGLLVPIIRNAGDKNLVGLVRSVADLAARTRAKKLQPDELQGGTFTVTNVGSLGSIMGTPIINQPQVAILATGAIKKRPVVVEDPELGDIIAIRHMMYLSLSYDHRIIDGAMSASFLRKMIDSLESIDTNEVI